MCMAVTIQHAGFDRHSPRGGKSLVKFQVSRGCCYNVYVVAFCLKELVVGRDQFMVNVVVVDFNAFMPKSFFEGCSSLSFVNCLSLEL